MVFESVRRILVLFLRGPNLKIFNRLMLFHLDDEVKKVKKRKYPHKNERFRNQFLAWAIDLQDQ